jgi:N-acyl-L-homoserine lactone synthetase
MIQVIDRTNRQIHGETLHSYFELRHAVFIGRLGWQLDCAEEGIERDQFDNEDAIYLTVSNRHGQVVGGARLLDTSRRSLLGEIFPDLVDGPIPADPGVYEVTRFVVDPRRERLEGCGDVCAELLWGLQEFGIWAGLDRLVSVSYVSLEPILRRAGYRSCRLGPSLTVDGTQIVARSHEIAPEVRDASRRRVKVEHAVKLPADAFLRHSDHHRRPV